MTGKPKFYTTSIDASKTAGEIGETLRKYGARRYQVEFDDSGDPVGLAFAMVVDRLGVEVPVQLTAQIGALMARMKDEGVLPNRASDADYRRQATRTAWRQLKAWVELSMEMVENGVKPFHEVFMADVLLEGGVRLVDRFEEESGRLLPEPTEAKVIALPSGD